MHHDTAAIVAIDDPHMRAKRQTLVSGRHGSLVETLAIRRQPALVLVSIVRGYARFVVVAAVACLNSGSRRVCVIRHPDIDPGASCKEHPQHCSNQ